MKSFFGGTTESVRESEDMRTDLTSRWDNLRTFGLQVLNLKNTLDANADAGEQLFGLAHFLRDNAPRYEGQHNLKILRTLNHVLDDIFSFEREVEKESKLHKVSMTDAYRNKVDAYSIQLNDVWLRYQAITVAYLSEASRARDLAERERHILTPIPIEQLSALLPPEPAIYVGHDEERNALARLLQDHHSPHVIVLGGPGMGKTALATKAMYESTVEAKFGNRRFFINCDGAITAEAVVAALASLFHVAESTGFTLQQALLNYLRSFHAPVLIVLDNLESAWDSDDQTGVETFLSHLCRIDLLAVLVTMRGATPPHGPLWHQKLMLQPLSMADARSMFGQLYWNAEEADEKSLHQLLELLDGLPLAITLLACVGLTGYKPSELLTAYRDEQTSMVKRGRGKDRLSNLDISITVSLNCQTMKENPGALTVLELLSLLPDGLDGQDRTSALPKMTQYSSAARVLVQIALCTRQNGICRVLAPIRSYVQIHHPPSGPHLEDLLHYHFQLAHKGWNWESEPQTTRAHLDRRMGNLQTVLHYAIGKTVEVKVLLEAVLALSHFSRLVFIGDCKPHLQAAIATYTGSSESDIRALLAACRLELGETLSLRYDVEGAIAVLQDAEASLEAVGNRFGVARCLWSLANLLRLQDDYEGSTMALKKAKEICEGLGDLWGVAQCLLGLGNILYMQSDFDNATATLQEAKTTFEAGDSRFGVAKCTKRLADIMLSRNSYDGAQAALNEAKTQYDDLGHRLGVAQCTQSLSAIMQFQNDYDGATKALQEARSGFVEIGEPLGAAQCTQQLGEVMKLHGNYDGAVVELKHAKEAFADIGDRKGVAWCTRDQGEIMLMRNDYDGATSTLKEAKAVFDEIDHHLEAAQCLLKLGVIMQKRADFEGATAALQEAKAAFDGSGLRLLGAQCAQYLAEVMRLQGNFDGARKTLNDAKATFEDIGHRLGTAQCTQQLSHILKAQRDFDGARAALEQSKAVFEGIGDVMGVAQSDQLLGDLKRICGDLEGATLTLTAAKATFDKMGVRESAARCTQDIGNVKDMRKDYEGAIAAFKEAQAVFEDVGDRTGAANCLRFIGDVLAKQGDYDGAEKALMDAKSVFEETGQRVSAAQCALGLTLVMEGRQDYNGAIECIEEARAIYVDVGMSANVKICNAVLGNLTAKKESTRQLTERSSRDGEARESNEADN